MSKAWSKDIRVEPHTFGGTKACEVLADMLNNNVIPIYEKHRVLSFINSFTCYAKNAGTIQHQGTRNKIMSLLLKEYLERVDAMPYPNKMKSFLRNVLHHHCRKNLEDK